MALESELHSFPALVEELMNRNAQRRSTFPDICLTKPDDAPNIEVDVWVVGDEGVGKTTLLRNLLCSATELAVGAEADEPGPSFGESVDEQEFVTCIQVDDEDVTLRFRECNLNEIQVQRKQERYNAYVVAYTVIDRISFSHAVDALYYLIEGRKRSRGKCIPLVLAGTKNDLERKRQVSRREGHALAKIYRCSFMETSSLMSFHLESLTSALLAQIRHLVTSDSKALEAPKKGGFLRRLRRSSRRMVRSCENVISRLVK